MYLVAVVVLCFLAVAQSQNMCFVLRSHELGNVTNPALSCSEIAQQRLQRSSGMYWLKPCTSEQAVQVYCDLEKEFPTGTKGWVRVANLNMTDPSQQCPPNFNLSYTQPKRLCGKSTSGSGCDSVNYSTSGLQYNKVCGRVVGYQFKSTDGFLASFCTNCDINKAYVDGISITYGSPRKHIWTLAAGLYETGNGYYSSNCPCNSPGAGTQPPSFVGSDYYCESGLNSSPWTATVYSDDPLWDGEGCGGNEAPCCSPPDLPWFCKELPEPASDDLEVHICTDEHLTNEDVPVEVIELYVQ